MSDKPLLTEADWWGLMGLPEPCVWPAGLRSNPHADALQRVVRAFQAVHAIVEPNVESVQLVLSENDTKQWDFIVFPRGPTPAMLEVLNKLNTVSETCPTWHVGGLFDGLDVEIPLAHGSLQEVRCSLLRIVANLGPRMQAVFAADRMDEVLPPSLASPRPRI